VTVSRAPEFTGQTVVVVRRVYGGGVDWRRAAAINDYDVIVTSG